jgi:hypothetical protein
LAPSLAPTDREPHHTPSGIAGISPGRARDRCADLGRAGVIARRQKAERVSVLLEVLA